MNVTAHQEKKNETVTGKRRAAEERDKKQVTDFEEAECCLTAVVQGAAPPKNKRECPR